MPSTLTSVMQDFITIPAHTEDEWYRANDCEHAHCPQDCDHPQPFMDEGQLICGCCAIKGNVRIMMKPCTPEVCRD